MCQGSNHSTRKGSDVHTVHTSRTHPHLHKNGQRKSTCELSLRFTDCNLSEVCDGGLKLWRHSHSSKAHKTKQNKTTNSSLKRVSACVLLVKSACLSILLSLSFSLFPPTLLERVMPSHKEKERGSKRHELQTKKKHAEKSEAEGRDPQMALLVGKHTEMLTTQKNETINT